MALADGIRTDTRRAITPPSLLFAGSVFCDLVFSIDRLPDRGGEVMADQFTVSAGGTANRAVAAARLGVRAAISGRIGADLLGSAVMAQLREEPNLDISRLRVDAGMQTPVTVSLADHQDRSFITYEEPPGPAIPVAADSAAVFRCCHVSAADEIPAWVGTLRQAGTTIVGGAGWDGTGTWSPEFLRRIQGVDVLCANEVEAVNYTRTQDPAAAARELARRVPAAVVTCGKDGVIAAEAATGTFLRVPAIPVTAIDPTGAGDIFVAALMVGIAYGWPLEDQLKMATAAAAISVGKLGGASAAPTRAEIAGFLGMARPDGDWAPILKWLTESPPLPGRNSMRPPH
jgi:sugar/nucleoside kinase (ribokinase family)